MSDCNEILKLNKKWTDMGKNAHAFQCSVATFRDFKITNFTEIEKEKKYYDIAVSRVFGS